MTGYIVVAVLGLLVGGCGGYEWGRAAEAKAQALANALKQSAQNVAATVKKVL